MKAYMLHEYDKAGCPWLKEATEKGKDAIFRAVLMATGGKVCDTGCAQFEEGKCIGYQNLVKKEV